MNILYFEDHKKSPLLTDGNSGRGAIAFAFDEGLLEIEADRILKCAETLKRGKRFHHFHEDAPIWAADVL